MVLNLWKHIQPEKLILAHMGGWRLWDEVEEKLVGLPFYMDTAVVLNRRFPVRLGNEQFVRMVRKHGADKILFGTDSPWYDQKQALEDFDNTGLNDDEKKLDSWRKCQKTVWILMLFKWLCTITTKGNKKKERG